MSKEACLREGGRDGHAKTQSPWYAQVIDIKRDSNKVGAVGQRKVYVLSFVAVNCRMTLLSDYAELIRPTAAYDVAANRTF